MNENKFYLKSESHTMVIPEITKADGEIIPQREVKVGARALYFPYDLTRRRYRDLYPVPHNKTMRLYKCKTLKHILEERQSLFEYCGEWFDVYDNNGKVEITESTNESI